MSEPLALYHSVMGKLWEEERIRGQQHGPHRGTSGRAPTGTQLPADQVACRPATCSRVRARESRAAVFKRIRAGGCKTRARLFGNQLAYVNDKAIYTYSTMTNPLTDGAVLSDAQKEEIIEAWSETWRGTTKLGFTSHMLLSFPTNVSVDQVKDITLDWAEHFFESGDYGDHGITCSRCMTTGRINTPISS